MKKRTYIAPQFPLTSGINIEYYSIENYCRTHHANHSERTCPKFINSFTTMLTPPKPPRREKRNEKEEEEEDQEEEEEEEGEELNLTVKTRLLLQVLTISLYILSQRSKKR